MWDKSQVCCFTGHRDISDLTAVKIRRKLTEVIENLISEGVIYYGSGGALGFDSVAAGVVIKLKKKYPQIKLILVLPCENQTRGWKEHEKDYLDYLKRNADKIVIISKKYTNTCMMQRNRRLVDHSRVCISYMTKNTGGTANTVRYAMECGLKLINIRV